MPDMRRLLLHRMPALNNIARLPWIKGNIRKLEKGGSLWEPSRLFDNGEQGAWYDPSDLSTMFQDSAGTTPVTADGQPVGLILDKSQSLALGPELVVNGDFASGTSAGWTMSFNASGSSVINEEFNLVISGGSGGFYQDIPVVMGQYYELSALMRKVSGSNGVRIQVYDGASFTNLIAQYGFVTTVGSAIKYMFRLRTALSSVLRIYLTGQDGATGGYDNVSVKLLSGNHASQATAAARPLYKTDGTYHWLQFDGVDDGLSTAATTFGAGNFNSVYGMKRATVGNDVVAFSGSGVYFAITATGNSSLAFGAVGSTIRHFVNSVEIGTINATTRNEMHLATPATQKKVLTIKDFLASSFNPLQFGNYGGSYTFEGSLFSYIMADGMTPAEIAQTEAWVNSKTGAY